MCTVKAHIVVCSPLSLPFTFLSIERYSVVPLSPNSGLIGWVPHCDTIHSLIRDYREKKKIMLNIEHRLMLQVKGGGGGGRGEEGRGRGGEGRGGEGEGRGGEVMEIEETDVSFPLLPLSVQTSSDYEHLMLMQKVEVFEQAIESTSGDDLAKVLWLKSPSSEVRCHAVVPWSPHVTASVISFPHILFVTCCHVQSGALEPLGPWPYHFVNQYC